MLLKLDEPRLFVNLVSVASEMVTEVRLKVSSEGMSLVAVDPASVGMVFFNIPADLFSRFDVEKDETLGVNLEDLKGILRRVKPGSKLTMERDENMLRLIVEDRIRRDFALALISVEGEQREIPQWDFTSVIKMDSQSFVDVVEDCGVVSDACTFIAEPNKFIVEARGLNSARAEFSSDEIEIASSNATSRYSLEYLNKFIKGAKLSDKVGLNFSDNMPLRIDFTTGKVRLSFVLAPRVEQDD